jgi:hypothetical protein
VWAGAFPGPGIAEGVTQKSRPVHKLHALDAMERVSRVTILHDSPSSLGSSGPAGTSSMADAEDVAGVLMAAGMEVGLLEAKGDLNAVVRGIGERHPDLVFNLVESFAGEPRYRPDIAAALDLVGVPYTGAGPSGLHLSDAPELARRLLLSYGIGALAGARAALRLAVVGNDRLAVFPPTDDALAVLGGSFAALRLRDYALVEIAVQPEPAIVRAIPNPRLGRKGTFARVAAEAGFNYDDLVLSIADEAWDRHKEVAVAVKTA